MSTRTAKKLTSINLQNTLWDVINLLKSGKIDAKTATAMAKQSAEICKIERLKLAKQKVSKKDLF